jgi:putative flippase GtrA
MRRHRVPGEFVRFAAAGAIGTAAHYAVLILLVEIAAMPPAFAAAAGAGIGATLNYFLNYRITFRSTARHSVTGPRFALIAVAGMALNSVVVFMFVRFGLHYLLGQVLATLLVLVTGFLANRLWTFSEAQDDDSRH